MPKKRKSNDADIDAVTNMLVLNEMIVVLTEEFLEVVRALQGEGDVKEELIQTASVCIRILEMLE